MEIRIDTAKDSKEDIRKMVDFLQRFVAETGMAGSVTARATKDEAIVPAKAEEIAPTAEEPGPLIVEVEEIAEQAMKTEEPQPGMLAMFDETQPKLATPLPAPMPEEVTKTQNGHPTVTEIFKDPLKVLFPKNDTELEEVQRLKKMSKTTSEDLRVIAYR